MIALSKFLILEQISKSSKVEVPIVTHLGNFGVDCEQYEVMEIFFYVGR